jgi:hypothetical protein
MMKVIGRPMQADENIKPPKNRDALDKGNASGEGAESVFV